MSDVFDEDDDDNNINAREFDRISKNLVKEGYREGLAAGHEETLQTGFNIGFKNGANVLMEVSTLRGKIWAKLAYGQCAASTELSDDNKSSLSDLLSQLTELENEIMQLTKTGNVQLSVTSDFEDRESSTENISKNEHEAISVSETSSSCLDKDIPHLESDVHVLTSEENICKPLFGGSDVKMQTCSENPSEDTHGNEKMSVAYRLVENIESQFCDLQLKINDICSKNAK